MIKPPVDPIDIARARAAGRFAARRKLPATACPHDPAGDGHEKVLAASWVRGYLNTRPPSTDYNGDDES